MTPLREMQALVQERWRREKPLVQTHVGDLAWWSREGNWENVRLWHEDGNLVAWAWFTPPGELDFQGPPELVLDAYPDAEPVWALETDRARTTALRERGYVPAEDWWLDHNVRTLDELPRTELPSGYRVRHLRGAAEVDARLAVHRAAWASSRLTREMVEIVMQTWPYRPELDWVVEAPDGSFAASCLAWIDEANGVGLLEPVGTHHEHRGRGLARAACLGALSALRGHGADTAVVLSTRGKGNRAATRLYRSLGFEPLARHVRFVRGDPARA